MKLYLEATPEQQDSLRQLYIEAHGEDFSAWVEKCVTPELGGPPVLLVSWKGMCVGVEPDGYRHT